MSDNNSDLIEYLCGNMFDIQGRLRANEIILNSLMSVICENAPELIEKLKEKINDTSQLSVQMKELSTDFAADAFQREIHQAILKFSLIEEASKYSPTRI